MSFEFIDHPADVGIKVTASTIENVFNDAAQALFAILYTPETVNHRRVYTISAHAPTLEFLVIEFLNELISTLDREDAVFGRCEIISLDDEGDNRVVHARCFGEELDKTKHNVRTEVKAATYSGLMFKHINDYYEFQCLFDV